MKYLRNTLEKCSKTLWVCPQARAVMLGCLLSCIAVLSSFWVPCQSCSTENETVIHDKDVWGVCLCWQGAADGSGWWVMAVGGGSWVLTALSAPSCLCNWRSLVKLNLAMHSPWFWGWLKLNVFWCRSPAGLHCLVLLKSFIKQLFNCPCRSALLVFFPIHALKWLLGFWQRFPSPLVLYIKLCDQLWSISISSVKFLTAVAFQTILNWKGHINCFQRNWHWVGKEFDVSS